MKHQPRPTGIVMPPPPAEPAPNGRPGRVLQARGITVARKGKVILNRVTFDVVPGRLTLAIGPNGAGKTTLMRALAGERPTEGQVLIDGHDSYADPEFWLQQVGYVPVDNVLHEHLTLQQTLTYAGQLRLPHLDRSEIAARVDALLTAFGFPGEDARRDKLIRVLSSGEVKRANICSELVTDPPILLLDEPTSSLDPNAEYELMARLADYAHQQNKTVLVITHTLNTIGLCDHVLFIQNSELAGQGPPHQVLDQLVAQFEIDGRDERLPADFYAWAMVFDKTRTRPSERRDYARSRLTTKHQKRDPQPVRVSDLWQHQLRCLFSRYVHIRWNDRWGLVATMLAGFSGLLFFVLPGQAFVLPIEPTERALALNLARQSVYLVSLVVALLGMITSYTEVSREYRIYAHERLKGLSPSAYLLSKWIWLAGAVGICAPVILVLCLVLVYQQPLPGFPAPHINEQPNWLENLVRFQLVGLLSRPSTAVILVTLVASCITSVTIGLLISCIAGASGRGHLYLAFAVVFMVLFSGLIQNARLDNLISTLSVLSTGKWAYEGIATTLNLYCWTGSWRFDEFNSYGHLLSVVLALAGLTVVAVIGSVAVLHGRDPWHRTALNLRLLVVRERAASLAVLSVLVLLFSYSFFLRSTSFQYHVLTYWSQAAYGGSNEYRYAAISNNVVATPPEMAVGILSQSWCSQPIWTAAGR